MIVMESAKCTWCSSICRCGCCRGMLLSFCRCWRLCNLPKFVKVFFFLLIQNCQWVGHIRRILALDMRSYWCWKDKNLWCNCRIIHLFFPNSFFTLSDSCFILYHDHTRLRASLFFFRGMLRASLLCSDFGSLWHMHMRSKQKCFLQIINIVIYIGAFGAQQPA